MDWSKGFSARYYMTVVDTDTWADSGVIDITEGSINRTNSGLRHSADVTCIDYDRSAERWVRIWLDARQGGEAYHGALFTGIACSPNREINGTVETNKLQCYSVLKPAEDVLMPRGWYAAAGTNGGNLVRSLLKSCGVPAPIIVDDDSPNLSYSVIAEDGETYLSMAEYVLSSINWRMTIDGDGTIYILPGADSLSGSFSSLTNDSIELSLNVNHDWFSCPNVFRAISGDTVALAVDNSEDSPLSVINRGREIWVEESNCSPYYGESLESYAQRRLEEEQAIYYNISYSRRFDPDINVSDLINLNYPEHDISGIFYVISQTINLGYGATVSEEANRIYG